MNSPDGPFFIFYERRYNTINNLNLAQNQLLKADRIIIDTCMLMKPERIRPFLQKYESWMTENNIQIHVPKKVCIELLKHMESPNKRVRHGSNAAMKLISEYKEIFIPDISQENAPGEEEFEDTFADNHIVSELIAGFPGNLQILITDDWKLKEDALDINFMKSCKGGKIRVMRFTDKGEAEITKQSTKVKRETILCATVAEEPKAGEAAAEEVPIASEESKQQQETAPETQPDADERIGATPFIVLGSAAAGFALGVKGPQLWKFVKHLAEFGNIVIKYVA